MADPEERLGSGVQACNDPLRGICCKAHCRTAEGGQKVNKKIFTSTTCSCDISRKYFHLIAIKRFFLPVCWSPVGGCPDQRAYW